MAQFVPALNFLLDREDPTRSYQVTRDNKGLVCAGVNSEAWPEDFEKIADAPLSARPELVANFYLARYWSALRLTAVTAQDVATRILSAAVNVGAIQAVKLLQRAINTLQTVHVAEDGVIGPKTIEAANSNPPAALLSAFRDEWVTYYEMLAAKNPDAYGRYLDGWKARAMA